MRRIAITAVLGFAAGMGSAWLTLERGWLSAPIDRRAAAIIEPVPQISLAAAESHRAAHFENIRSIEDSLALPGDFAQTEALYALAGRSNSAAVQDLIFQANGIGDPSDRRAALSILFSRLAELDPASALALARSRYFRSLQFVETTVWQTWGKLDLDAALDAAARLDSRQQRELAAQALFSALGHWGNEATERIARRTGTEPDQATRSRYLYGAAEDDPAAAIHHILSLRPSEQANAASLLGRYMGENDPDEAGKHAAMLPAGPVRQSFEMSVMSARARSAPESVLTELLGRAASRQHLHALHTAMESLAQRDLDLALNFLERAGGAQERQLMAAAVAQQFARQDPYRALAWARDGDHGLQSGAYMQVLATLAQTNPEVAVEEAIGTTRRDLRMQVLNMVSMNLAGSDPQQAVALLERLENRRDRNMVASAIASNWVHQDPDAALDWILGSEPALREDMLQQAGAMLAQVDPDAAIRLLPRLDDRAATSWRSRIAASLATQRSAAEAEAFIARFEGTDDYRQLVSATINGLSESDPDAAIRMVNRLAPPAERPAVIARLVPQIAMQGNPEEAAGILETIADEASRAQAAASVAGIWGQSDPVAAEQWAANLPRGEARDHAIAGIAAQWEDMTPARQALLASIGDPEKRKEAQVSRIYHVAQVDPQRASRMLDDVQLTDQERETIAMHLQSISEQGIGFGRIRSTAY